MLLIHISFEDMHFFENNKRTSWIRYFFDFLRLTVFVLSRDHIARFNSTQLSWRLSLWSFIWPVELSRGSADVISALTPSTPAVLNCYCLKGSAPYWSNPRFLIFDIRAFWRSVLSARTPECQKLKIVG